MATEVMMKNRYTGGTKMGVYGFSWTYFLFGPFVCAYRGEWGDFFKHALLTLVTAGFYAIYAWFSYNKEWMRKQIAAGWELAGTPEQNAMAVAEIGMGHPNAAPVPQQMAAPVIVQMPAQGVAPAQGTPVQQTETQQLPPPRGAA